MCQACWDLHVYFTGVFVFLLVISLRGLGVKNVVNTPLDILLAQGSRQAQCTRRTLNPAPCVCLFKTPGRAFRRNDHLPSNPPKYFHHIVFTIKFLVPLGSSPARPLPCKFLAGHVHRVRELEQEGVTAGGGLRSRDLFWFCLSRVNLNRSFLPSPRFSWTRFYHSTLAWVPRYISCITSSGV